MRHSIENVIMRFYPEQKFICPLEDPKVIWDYDENWEDFDSIKKDLSDLNVEHTITPHDSTYSLSFVFAFSCCDVYLSSAGPFAKLTIKNEDSTIPDKIKVVLNNYNIELLTNEELEEKAAWIIDHDGPAPTVFDCLF